MSPATGTDPTTTGPRVTGLTIADDPDAWRDAGFTVRGDRCGIGGVTLHLCGAAEPRGYRSWTLSGVPAATTIDGMVTEVGVDDPAGRTDEPPPHPNGAMTLDHIVWLTPDGARTAEAVTTATGRTVRRVRDASRDDRALTQRFFRFGEIILEVVSGEPATDGPVAFFGIAVTVDDLDASVAALAPHVSEIRPAVQPGRRVATLRTRALDISIPVLLISRSTR